MVLLPTAFSISWAAAECCRTPPTMLRLESSDITDCSGCLQPCHTVPARHYATEEEIEGTLVSGWQDLDTSNRGEGSEENWREGTRRVSRIVRGR